jgi:hypothetical protein
MVYIDAEIVLNCVNFPNQIWASVAKNIVIEASTTR